MDLSRLRDIVRSGGTRVPAVPPRRELTYEAVGDDGLPLESRRELPEIEGAAWLTTPHGDVVAIDAEFRPEFLHGRVAVETLSTWDPHALTLIGGRPVQPERSPLFLDLETTGLSGGAGTVPFLVGCGYFDGGTFRTRQFFLNGFAGERALLHAVTAFVEGTSLLVTFNGRTFDVPVMETRWLFHRMPVALEGVPHLDMLPPSRRLWRAAAEDAECSCRLVSLEERLCGVMRVGDVPGCEIPQRYFDYVRHGDARRLEPVLYHNRMDLLSLAALTARAQRLVCGGADEASDPAECLALGRLLERRGHRDEAERCFRRVAVDFTTSHVQREHALHALALLLRRGRRFVDAAAAWRELLAHGVGRSPAVSEAVEALAVHHEHRERDLREARALALRALGQERDPRRREAVSYRLARLERKLAQVEGEVRQGTLMSET